SHSLDVVRARPFNHTGPGQTPDFVCSEFARALAAAERGSGPKRLRVGNLEVERDFSDVREVVRGCLSVFWQGVGCKGFNVGAGRGTRGRTVLDELRAECRVPVEIDVDPRKLRPREVDRVVGSIEKIGRDTGWRPEIPLRQTLVDLLHYWRQELVR